MSCDSNVYFAPPSALQCSLFHFTQTKGYSPPNLTVLSLINVSLCRCACFPHGITNTHRIVVLDHRPACGETSHHFVTCGHALHVRESVCWFCCYCRRLNGSVMARLDYKVDLGGPFTHICSERELIKEEATPIKSVQLHGNTRQLC